MGLAVVTAVPEADATCTSSLWMSAEHNGLTICPSCCLKMLHMHTFCGHTSRRIRAVQVATSGARRAAHTHAVHLDEEKRADMRHFEPACWHHGRDINVEDSTSHQTQVAKLLPESVPAPLRGTFPRHFELVRRAAALRQGWRTAQNEPGFAASCRQHVRTFALAKWLEPRWLEPRDAVSCTYARCWRCAGIAQGSTVWKFSFHEHHGAGNFHM